MMSRKLSGLPPRNRVSWVPLLGGGYFGIDINGVVVSVRRVGRFRWACMVAPLLGDGYFLAASRSLTARGSRAKVDRLVRKAQGHG